MKEIYLVTDGNYCHFFNLKQFATSLDEVIKVVKLNIKKFNKKCIIKSVNFVNDTDIQVIYEIKESDYTYGKTYYVTKLTKYELL